MTYNNPQKLKLLEKELETLKNSYLIAPNLHPEDEEKYFKKQEELNDNTFHH